MLEEAKSGTITCRRDKKGIVAFTAHEDVKRFLGSLNQPDRFQRAGIWYALRKICGRNSEFESATEELIIESIFAMCSAKRRSSRRLKSRAELIGGSRKIANLAHRLERALYAHHEFMALPSGEYWRGGDLESTIGQFSRSRAPDPRYFDDSLRADFVAVVRANAPTMRQLLQRLQTHANWLADQYALQRAPKSGRRYAEATHFLQKISSLLRSLFPSASVASLAGVSGTIVQAAYGDYVGDISGAAKQYLRRVKRGKKKGT